MDNSVTLKTILVEFKKERDVLKKKITDSDDGKKLTEINKKIRKCVKELTEVKPKESAK